MNMTVLTGPEGSSQMPDISDDDVARRITLFKRSSVGVSHKCPIISQQHDVDIFEYGWYPGHIEIEDAVQAIQIQVCNTLARILEKTPDPHTIIENIFRKRYNVSKTFPTL